ncbi:FlgM family anti-sigma-28 factor [Panacagrimonas perspica]|uniref:Negative regulator of flagellin synthesis n=1 Tax=Panacagrimonas perspica TaxID=381431 RepID=A0A4S3KAL2_9GAMM|nr:flagellar biosynthesis anti-sigma factor FlgM [Panacagrimonas perspica]TDU32467.1 FlgM family anti-sigma-28 factor [Panacagrimonas perspica]THD05383.1 flagellar biosynthesis anti-sigma factor FlgM [Panacagrimonas perspica]
MSTKIDTSVGPAAAPAPVRPVARPDSSGTPASSSTSHAKSADSMALTGEARAMQEFEQRVQNDSGVDETKVAEMRRILAQGLYNADPSAIAGRLMQLEWSLSRTP